jgi:hypothetical protein
LRKVAILMVALVACLATAVIAIAQGGGNSYEVEASVSPNRSGTTSRPQPVKVTFNYSVDGPNTSTQPDAVNRYKIELYGIRENGARFTRCTAASMQRAQSDADCPAGSRMGTGRLQAVVYQTGQPGGTNTFDCVKTIRYYNAGNRRAVIYLTGPGSACAGVSQPFIIPARFVNGAGGGEALQFDVAPTILHPVPELTVAVRNVTTTIRVATRRVRGKRVGYFESRRCQGSRRPIRVTFRTEAGQTSRATDNALCRRTRARRGR